MKTEHIIAKIEPDSIAGELELEAGDRLLEINGKTVEDVFDYRYLINDEYLTILIEKQNGEQWELEIEKDADEDLGIEFDNGLMDDYRSCSNRCIFCFIDQMPPGMRETLYFKDDDSRLSFLQGNYVTLTNMKQKDIDRIIFYHLGPINISFQAMNPQLRCKMLHNRFAGEALKKVDQLYQAGITMNGQIVLCKGINDGEELEYSLQKLSEYAPVLQSISIVPVGLTKFREGLYPLEPFKKEDAHKLIETIHGWQQRMYKKCGLHFVHLSDEWYLLAGEPLPPEESYDDYLQLENGVGMLRLLQTEMETALKAHPSAAVPGPRKISIATGLLAAPCLEKIAEDIQKEYSGIEINIYPITNNFFGSMITVSGLITGADLKDQLKDKDLGDCLLIPCNMLRSGEDVFLDDITLDELAGFLNIEIEVAESSGEDLLNAVLGIPSSGRKRRNTYEQTGSCNCRKA